MLVKLNFVNVKRLCGLNFGMYVLCVKVVVLYFLVGWNFLKKVFFDKYWFLMELKVFKSCSFVVIRIVIVEFFV